MTEAGWLASDDPRPMLECVQTKSSERKLRLLVCAVCRRHRDKITKSEFREAIEVAERYADGLATEDERVQAWRATDYRSQRRSHSSLARFLAGAHDAVSGSGDFSEPDWYALHSFRRTQADAAQARFLRDIFGNPFRPVTLDPAWLTSTVVALARGIYEGRAFDRLPILADALQDAGCDCAELLDHCRDPQLTHVRGCWAVDLVLGKS
jgi:hypothetical protein